MTDSEPESFHCITNKVAPQSLSKSYNMAAWWVVIQCRPSDLLRAWKTWCVCGACEKEEEVGNNEWAKQGMGAVSGTINGISRRDGDEEGCHLFSRHYMLSSLEWELLLLTQPSPSWSCPQFPSYGETHSCSKW